MGNVDCAFMKNMRKNNMCKRCGAKSVNKYCDDCVCMKHDCNNKREYNLEACSKHLCNTCGIFIQLYGNECMICFSNVNKYLLGEDYNTMTYEIK